MNEETLKIITIIISSIAIVVSVIALLTNRWAANRNIRLSIQQAIFRIVTDKAKDCNLLWKSEPENEKNETSPHFNVVSELVISREVIEKSFFLFGKNSESIKGLESDFFYLLWKQLNTDLRGFFRKAKELRQYKDDENFKKQIDDLYVVFEAHFE